MKATVWKTLKIAYAVFALVVIGAGFAYGIPLYRYLKQPAGQIMAPAPQPAPASAAAGKTTSSDNSGPWGAAILNADAAALPGFRSAVDKVAPNNPKAYTGLGLLYQMKGLKNEAISIYEKALRIDPSYVDARYRLGTVYHELGRFDDAIWQYQEVLKTKTDHLESLFGLGAILQEKNRLREAEDTYLKILSFKPGEYQALNNLGIVYEKLEQFGKALSAFEAAHLAKPGDAVVKENWESAKKSYPDVRPAPLTLPAPAPAVPDSPPRTEKPKPLFSSQKTHYVTLKNGQGLSGSMGEETPNGFWFVVDDGASVFVNRDEVLKIEKS